MLVAAVTRKNCNPCCLALKATVTVIFIIALKGKFTLELVGIEPMKWIFKYQKENSGTT